MLFEVLLRLLANDDLIFQLTSHQVQRFCVRLVLGDFLYELRIHPIRFLRLHGEFTIDETRDEGQT